MCTIYENMKKNISLMRKAYNSLKIRKNIRKIREKCY